MTKCEVCSNEYDKAFRICNMPNLLITVAAERRCGSIPCEPLVLTLHGFSRSPTEARALASPTASSMSVQAGLDVSDVLESHRGLILRCHVRCESEPSVAAPQAQRMPDSTHRQRLEDRGEYCLGRGL